MNLTITELGKIIDKCVGTINKFIKKVEYEAI